MIKKFIISILARLNNRIQFGNIISNRNSLFKLVKSIFYEIENIFYENLYSPTKLIIFKNILRKDYVMINIGGGKFKRKHWRVLDMASEHYNWKNEEFDYVIDLTKNVPFPFKDNSIKIFYSSHTFEHIPQEHCQHIFNEIFRCLKKKGTVRLTMPDFDKAYRAYKDNDKDFFKYPEFEIHESFLDFFATYFLRKISSEELKNKFKNMSKKEFADYYTNKVPRDYQKINSGNHINWWNFDKIKLMLYKSGFRKIFLSKVQKSRCPEMRGRGRNIGFDSTFPYLSLFAEAEK